MYSTRFEDSPLTRFGVVSILFSALVGPGDLAKQRPMVDVTWTLAWSTLGSEQVMQTVPVVADL